MSKASSTSVLPPSNVPSSGNNSKRGLRFWLIFTTICVSLFLSALDFTGLSTALPTIINDLHGDDFVWVGSGYALASTAVLPLSGGLAEVFGRRAIMIGTLLLFALGSALCGAAQNMTWLIAARVVQGIGGGGLVSLPNIIVSDLVPLSERGKFNGIIGLTWALASAIAPLIGGALASSGNWRWFFYMNLPISGIALVMTVLFLQLPTPPGSVGEKLSKIDWIGNVLCMGSTASFVIGLTWGGVSHPWTSVQVLAPLILGVVGIGLFILYEGFVATNPIIPWTLLKNRTSISGYVQTFINPIVVVAIVYYAPVYYQACKDASPIGSSVSQLSLSLVMAPVVALAAISVPVFKQYRIQMWLGWTIFIIAMGCFTMIEADTAKAVSIGLSVPISIGGGLVYGTTYFPVMSPLPVSENAHALAFFGFCRSFAGVWGVSIGAAILQNGLAKKIPQELLQALLGTSRPDSSNVDLAYSIIPIIKTLPEPLKHEVQVAFGESLSIIWKVMTGILAVGLLVSLLMKDVPLHDFTDEKWDLPAEKPASLDPTLREFQLKNETTVATVRLSMPVTVHLPMDSRSAG